MWGGPLDQLFLFCLGRLSGPALFSGPPSYPTDTYLFSSIWGGPLGDVRCDLPRSWGPLLIIMSIAGKQDGGGVFLLRAACGMWHCWTHFCIPAHAKVCFDFFKPPKLLPNALTRCGMAVWTCLNSITMTPCCVTTTGMCFIRASCSGLAAMKGEVEKIYTYCYILIQSSPYCIVYICILYTMHAYIHIYIYKYVYGWEFRLNNINSFIFRWAD